MANQVSILYAEDDRIVRNHIVELLSENGYDVRPFRDGRAAVSDFRSRRSDIVVLDVMMPVMSGHDACVAIREIDNDVPIIFHTALDSERDELSGLGLGADDFICKDSSDERFLARIAAAARRTRRPPSSNFVFGTGHVDVDACIFSDGNVSNRLSIREIEVLRIFIENPNAVLSKDFLQTRVFGSDYAGDLRSFDKTIERLKAKIGKSAALIQTIPRQGLAYAPPK